MAGLEDALKQTVLRRRQRAEQGLPPENYPPKLASPPPAEGIPEQEPSTLSKALDTLNPHGGLRDRLMRRNSKQNAAIGVRG